MSDVAATPIERLCRWFFRPRKCISCRMPLRAPGTGFCSEECAARYQDAVAW